jgi:uncharacterized membrane protein
MKTNIFTRYATCFMLATLLSFVSTVVAGFVLLAETNQITPSLMYEIIPMCILFSIFIFSCLGGKTQQKIDYFISAKFTENDW